MDVIDHSPFFLARPALLLVEVFQRDNGIESRFILKDIIQEIDKERLRFLPAEDILEAEIRHRVDKF